MYEEAARQILERVRSSYATEHKYRAVNAEDFGHLSLRFYNDAQKDLEALGFRRVVDVEDETVKRQTPDPRTFIRVMASNDGTVVAGIYHCCPTFVWRVMAFISGMRTRLVEFQTELENGYQVMTTAARRQDLLPTSPKMFKNFQPYGTPIAGLYKSHQGIIERVVMEAKVRPIANRTQAEILGFENRQMMLQREYLESIGWVTEDYLAKRSGCNTEMARAIYVEIQKILQEEKAGARSR